VDSWRPLLTGIDQKALEVVERLRQSLRAMFRRIYRQLAVLLFASFVLGLVNCAFASADAAGHCNVASDCHCVLHRDCHTPAVALCAGDKIALAIGSYRVAPSLFLLKLPLFATSIFNPPRA
jgi:hypothetical protein